MLSVSVDQRLRRIIDAFEVHRRLPVDIDEVAHRVGWSVHYEHDLAPIYGIALYERGHKLIVINADISRAWQRATLAHELGHWVCGHIQEGQQVQSHMDSWLSDDEDDATTVAAALLIPRTALLPQYTRLDIMATCDVPLTLVRHRLYML